MPASDDELTQAKKELGDLRGAVRQVLADELGGDPDEYRADSSEADSDAGD